MNDYPFQIWYDNLTPYDPPYHHVKDDEDEDSEKEEG